MIIAYCWQVRTDLGLPDHVWVKKRAAIAKQVDDLGDQFRPAMRKGWLDYIQKTYVADADDYVAAIGQGDLVVPDDDWLLWGPVLYPGEKVTEVYNKVTERDQKVTELQNSL